MPDIAQRCFPTNLMTTEVEIANGSIRDYRAPTGSPESDGTFAWHETTMELVEIVVVDTRGLAPRAQREDL